MVQFVARAPTEFKAVPVAFDCSFKQPFQLFSIPPIITAILPPIISLPPLPASIDDTFQPFLLIFCIFLLLVRSTFLEDFILCMPIDFDRSALDDVTGT